MGVILPIIIFAVWIFSIPVSVWEKHARGNSGGVSILPVISVFPLCAWGLAAILDWFHHRLGFIVIGGLHALLLLCFLVSAARSLYVIRQNK